MGPLGIEINKPRNNKSSGNDGETVHNARCMRSSSIDRMDNSVKSLRGGRQKRRLLVLVTSGEPPTRENIPCSPTLPFSISTTFSGIKFTLIYQTPSVDASVLPLHPLRALARPVGETRAQGHRVTSSELKIPLRYVMEVAEIHPGVNHVHNSPASPTLEYETQLIEHQCGRK